MRNYIIGMIGGFGGAIAANLPIITEVFQSLSAIGGTIITVWVIVDKCRKSKKAKK